VSNVFYSGFTGGYGVRADCTRKSIFLSYNAAVGRIREISLATMSATEVLGSSAGSAYLGNGPMAATTWQMGYAYHAGRVHKSQLYVPVYDKHYIVVTTLSGQLFPSNGQACDWTRTATDTLTISPTPSITLTPNAPLVVAGSTFFVADLQTFQVTLDQASSGFNFKLQDRMYAVRRSLDPSLIRCERKAVYGEFEHITPAMYRIKMNKTGSFDLCFSQECLGEWMRVSHPTHPQYYVSVLPWIRAVNTSMREVKPYQKFRLFVGAKATKRNDPYYDSGFRFRVEGPVESGFNCTYPVFSLPRNGRFEQSCWFTSPSRLAFYGLQSLRVLEITGTSRLRNLTMYLRATVIGAVVSGDQCGLGRTPRLCMTCKFQIQTFPHSQCIPFCLEASA